MSDLYSQWLGARGDKVDPTAASPGGWTKYQGSLPGHDGTPLQAPLSTVPYWDVPPGSLEPSGLNLHPWDTIFFGGQRFPGIARVKSKKHKRVDVKKKKGESAATMTFVGYGPAEIDVTLLIWTQTHLNDLQQLMPMLLPKPVRPGVATNFSPIDVSFPSLVLMNIRSLIVVAVDALEPASPRGAYSMKISCLEYYQPAKSDQTATAKGSSTFTANAAIKSGATNQAASTPKPSTTDVGTQIGFFR